jgi:hypothetical protein
MQYTMTDKDNDNNEKEPEEMIPYYFSNWKKINSRFTLKNRILYRIDIILNELG